MAVAGLTRYDAHSSSVRVEAMKKRSRVGRKPAKARPRKASKPKGRSVPKTRPGRRSTPGDQESEIARLTRERDEALEQQTATSEVLEVITSSSGDLQPAFEAILEKAVRICGATFGVLNLYEDDQYRITAIQGVHPKVKKKLEGSLLRMAPNTVLGRLSRTREAVHLTDALAEASLLETPMGFEGPFLVLEAGARTLLGVPMLKEGELLGGILIFRQEVRPFTEKQIALVTSFAAQAVIAIENTRLLTELRESLQEQTATAEVLQAISSSPGDLEPVFATMLEKAVRICEADFGNIFRWDGDALHLVATHNTPPALAEARRLPLRPDPKSPNGRMLSTKTAIHVVDLAAEQIYTKERSPETVRGVELGGIRTYLTVPMLKENELIGSLSLSRQVVRPFTDKQIKLEPISKLRMAVDHL
jgi:GAF domain-containing protein